MEHEQHPPTGPTFDTLKAAEALQQAGFTGAQARAVTQTVVESQANLASKADIKELRAEMMGEFKAQRAENQRLLAAFESHVAVLRAENKQMQETLRADFESLRADFKELHADNKRLEEKINTNRTLILGVGVPVLLALVGLSIAVVGLFFR